MVEGVRALPALVRGERPVFIESEGRDDLEGDGDGARVPNRLHHRGFVTLGDVHDLFHEDGGRLWLVLAGGAIVAQVRVRDLRVRRVSVSHDNRCNALLDLPPDQFLR